MIDGLGHARAFLALAVFPLVAVLALLLGRLRLPRPASPPQQRVARRVGDLLADRRLRHILVVSALFNVAWDVFVFVAPIYGTALNLCLIGVLSDFRRRDLAVRLALPALVRNIRMDPGSRSAQRGMRRIRGALFGRRGAGGARFRLGLGLRC
jgi:hypothetical protein